MMADLTREDIERAFNEGRNLVPSADDDGAAAIEGLARQLLAALDENEALRRAKAENDERFQVALADARKANFRRGVQEQ